jgi:hypothetical protein
MCAETLAYVAQMPRGMVTEKRRYNRARWTVTLFHVPE